MLGRVTRFELVAERGAQCGVGQVLARMNAGLWKSCALYSLARFTCDRCSECIGGPERYVTACDTACSERTADERNRCFRPLRLKTPISLKLSVGLGT